MKSPWPVPELAAQVPSPAETIRSAPAPFLPGMRSGGRQGQGAAPEDRLERPGAVCP